MVEFLAILTVELPGTAMQTVRQVLRIGPGTTREQVLQHMLQQAAPQFERASIVHFSVEPNALVLGGER
jgi:hypothetical protein